MIHAILSLSFFFSFIHLISCTYFRYIGGFIPEQSVLDVRARARRRKVAGTRHPPADASAVLGWTVDGLISCFYWYFIIFHTTRPLYFQSFKSLLIPAILLPIYGHGSLQHMFHASYTVAAFHTWNKRRAP